MSVWVCLLITRHSPFHTGRGLSYSMCLAKITQGTAQRRTAADGGDYGPKYDYTAAAAATTQNGASASAPGPDTTTLTATTAHSIQELTQTADQRLVS